VSALAQWDVGQYFNRHFVSAFQKVATFQINGYTQQKQGGNVASYFCTPEGRVLHAVAGPVNGVTLLQEARWVNETYQLAQLERVDSARLPAFFRKAHLERLEHQHQVELSEDRLPPPRAASAKALGKLLESNRHLSNEAKVHLLLSVAPLPRIEQVYRVIFEDVLNQQVTTNPVAVNGR
jgi:hypothetical protein